MSNLLKALNELREVNLSSEKVELGLVDDAKSNYKKLEKIQSIASKKVTRIRSDKAELQSDIDEMYDIVLNGEKAIDKAEKIAKELGVKLPKDVSLYAKAFKNAEVKAKSILKELGL